MTVEHARDGGADGDVLDVLVVGAGPTGLSLAAQLCAFGARLRIVDRHLDRAGESRALAVQPRTLEVLAGLGVTAQMLALGSRAVRLQMHFPGRTLQVPLFDVGLADTSYPFLLFLSQAETERILVEHLATWGVEVDRGVELIDLDAADADTLACTVRGRDGRHQRVLARYVVGCDGARSTVRQLAGIPFVGRTYPQTFVLADLEADGIAADDAHAFLSPRGMLFFFPLGQPATWRLLAMRPRTDPTPADQPVTLAEVQALTDRYATAPVRLRDPVWMTNFRLQNRGAARYRAGRIFLAGDAAHIHSPAGGQGMNTGIQDAVNLGWKLALVAADAATGQLLDTYQLERAPVGRAVLRFTDRPFTVATSTNPAIRVARSWLMPRLVPLGLRLTPARAAAFRTLSELAVGYRRSPLSTDGAGAPRHGPKAGDRLPDAPAIRDGQRTTLHAALGGPAFHLLACGPHTAWPQRRLAEFADRYPDLLAVHRLSPDPAPAALHDPDRTALHRLGADTASAHYLIRPDGHIAYRAGGTDLTGAVGYLTRWLPTPRHRTPPPPRQ